MELITEHEIYMAIKSGVTPRALAAAYEDCSVRDLHYKTKVPQTHLIILKERWDIGRTPFRCPHCRKQING